MAQRAGRSRRQAGTQPALPRFAKNASVGGTSLRGVGFRGGAYTDLPGIVPLSGAVATEVNTPHVGFGQQTFYPAVIATPNYFDAFGGGQTRLLVTPAQHRSEGPTVNTTTLRKFHNVDVTLFYSSNVTAAALTSAPSIVDVTAVDNGADLILFDAHVSADPTAGIQGVWVTYTGFDSQCPASPAPKCWLPLDLEQDLSDPGHWTGSLEIPSGSSASDIRFMIQAVSGVGLVGRDDNRSAFFSIDQPASTPTPAATTDDPRRRGGVGRIRQPAHGWRDAVGRDAGGQPADPVLHRRPLSDGADGHRRARRDNNRHHRDPG